MKGLCRVADRAVARNSLRECRPPGVGDRQPRHLDQPLPSSRRSRLCSREPVATKSCSVSIRKPCVRRMDSVPPFGLPASIRNASRWSKGIAMPAPLHHSSAVRERRRGDAQEILSAPPRREGAARGVTVPAIAACRKPRRAFPHRERQRERHTGTRPDGFDGARLSTRLPSADAALPMTT
jgi:hypothetical protein